MPEPFSTVVGLGMSLAALRASARKTTYSDEGEHLREAVAQLIDLNERSFSISGAQNTVIASIREIASNCSFRDWDGYGAAPISARALKTAEALIRALPSGFPLPEVAPEPDGAISLDWTQSRRRSFSVSAGQTDRLAFAWLDGTDGGHGVERFDGVSIPRRIAEGISSIVNVGASVRTS
ncbi:MAG: hypothetical protein ACT4OZ_09795 [Gemmatimonadota bacterium]